MAFTVFVKQKNGTILPEYQTRGSAGADIRACLAEPVTLKPLQRQLIPTGLFVELPSGTEMQIRPRSGLALNHGITVLNAPGTVDSDYRGELYVLLINLGDKDFVIKNGDRIAQAVIAKHEQALFKQKENLSETGRGKGGYGSTGIH